VSGQLHALAALLLGKVPQYPLNKRLGGPQNQSGCSGEDPLPPFFCKIVNVYDVFFKYPVILK
jgi:hypothetical protein